MTKKNTDLQQQESSDLRYEFHILEYLQSEWSDWLGGLAISHLENGETTLSGTVVDQAAFHGLLAKIRDLNLTILCVRKLGRLEKCTSKHG